MEDTCSKAAWKMDLSHTLAPVVAMTPEGKLGSPIKKGAQRVIQLKGRGEFTYMDSLFKKRGNQAETKERASKKHDVGR